MDTIPLRPRIASFYRAALSLCEKYIVLPDINPAYYQLLAICLSVLFFYIASPLLKIFFITVVLLTDWLDGATARSHRQLTKSGYIADSVIDRASEAFIFVAEVGALWGPIFFLLWLINSALTLYSAHAKKHLALPLRFVYMLVLMAQVIWQSL